MKCSANRSTRRSLTSTLLFTWRTRYDGFHIIGSHIDRANTPQTPIGKVDEILGPINQVYFTIKPQEGIVATSFKPGDKVYIGGDKLLPLEK